MVPYTDLSCGFRVIVLLTNLLANNCPFFGFFQKAEQVALIEKQKSGAKPLLI